MKNSGFTLVEMLITITILVIVLAIGAPSFNNFLSNSSMVSNSNDMIGAFNYARIEAMKRGSSVSLGQVVPGTWVDGIVVFIDSDGNTTHTSGEELRLWTAFENGMTVNSDESRTVFTFSGSGEVNNDDVLTICDDRTGEQGMQISILLSGAVIPEKVTCG